MLEVTLREILGDQIDCETLVAWRNENAQWFPKQEPWTVWGQQEWYNSVYIRDPSQNMYFVLVNSPGSSAKCLIGVVTVTIKHGSGYLGMMILGNKNYARGGYMRQGMRQLMDAYGLSHYWLRVMPDNEATIRFHKRNGFTVSSEEGGSYENVHGEFGEYLVMTRSYDGYWPEVPVK